MTVRTISANAVVVPARRVPPRIYRVIYRSRRNGRLATGFVKVPYSGLFDLAEKLARLLTVGEIRWYRLDVATPEQIMAVRGSLARWPDWLARSSAITRIDPLA